MNENLKTTGFVLGAVLLVGLAIFMRQEDRTEAVPDEVGQRLFASFEDPLKAASLEVVSYDTELGKPERFKVAQVNGVWTIPSHSGYPADASQQVARAANSVIDLKVLGIASDKATDHDEFGVLEPDEAKIKPGQEGVGMLVALQDSSEKDLARLIIGKPVQGESGIRYVRRVGQDRVYRVAVDTSSLSTTFSDWIETDLLKLTSFDLNKLILNDYSSQIGVTAAGQIGVDIPRNSTITLRKKPVTNQWEVEQLLKYEDNQPIEVELAADEQLNEAKLRDLSSALDTLKIVDVERKPEGMSGNLKAAKSFLESQAAIRSLAERGFFFGPLEDDEARLYSSEGELIAGTRDGVQYVLRFGNIANVTAGEDSADKPAGESTTDETHEEGSSVNRYLFVMAEFNEDLIEKPEIKPVPGEEPAADGQEPASTDESAQQPPADAATSEEPATDAAQPAADAAPNIPDAAPSEKVPAPDASQFQPGDELLLAQNDEAEPQAGETSDAVPVAEGDTAEAAPPSGETTAAAPAGESTADNPAGSESTDQVDGVSAESQRRAIEAENRSNQKAYDEKVAAGKKKVEELNARFADWYYVIPDDVYRKIHLSFNDVIEKKKADDSGNAAGSEAAFPSFGQ